MSRKKWRADSIEVTDGSNEEYSWRLKRQLRTRLENSLLGETAQQERDAAVIAYWWD